MSECLVCEEELDSFDECPNGCTEAGDYLVLVGAAWDEYDVLRESRRRGECLNCSATLVDDRCPVGCLDEVINLAA